MAEYIDRDAVCYQLQKWSTIDRQRRAFRRAEKIVAAFPAADVVERKTGKWVKISPAGIYECSQCGQNVMTSDIEAYKFCHGCGAKMEVPANV